MTIDPTSALTTAYWDNFLTMTSSSLGRDWDRLDQVDQIIRDGGRSATDLVLELIETAPRDRDGWLSYLLTGPIEDLWSRSGADQAALLEASGRSADLAEALVHLNSPSTSDPERTARKSKRPSKRRRVVTEPKCRSASLLGQDVTVPSLPYRIAARWDLDLSDADRKTGRAVSGALVGAGFIGIAAGAGLGALLAALFGIDLKWIMWLATPGWVVLLFGCAISADLTVHPDLDALSPVSYRLLSHWVFTSLLFALPWACWHRRCLRGSKPSRSSAEVPFSLACVRTNRD